MRASILLAGLPLALAGCALTPEPGVYDVPPQTAWTLLQQADTGAFALNRDCGPVLDISAEHTASRIVWTVRAESSTLVSFAVRLEPVGDGKVRATVDLPLDPANRKPLIAPSGAAALRQPLQGAVAELVDAALQRRPFDPKRIGDPRSKEEACGPMRAAATPPPVNPWGKDAAEPTTFGAPMLASGPDQAPAARRSGALEDMPMDQPPIAKE